MNAEIDRIASYLPDLSITERPPSGFPATGKSSTLAVAEPFFIPRITELRTERTLQIVDPRSGNRIITTIEILSPTNKNDSKGRIAYRKKQQQLADSDINLVEIDLLRGGSYVLIPPWDSVPRSCRGTYRVAVSRATDPENFEMYRVLLRQRLPAIKIPLRPNDPDARLDLQLLIDAAYENGGYGSDIDYSQQPIPPFNTEDATWAAAVIREASPR